MTASPSQTFRADRFSIGLAALGFALACALGAVLLLPDGESSATLSPTTGTVSPTTAAAESGPSSSSSVATTTNVPFSMPASLEGSWEAADSSATATFTTAALLDLEAVVTSGDGSSIRYVLTRPSAIGPTPGPTVPAGIVLEGSVELNGVQQPIRTVGSLVPRAAGLHLSFPLTIDPSLFDMSGPTTTVPVELVLLPS